jgi:hypothetical protein
MARKNIAIESLAARPLQFDRPGQDAFVCFTAEPEGHDDLSAGAEKALEILRADREAFDVVRCDTVKEVDGILP